MAVSTPAPIVVDVDLGKKGKLKRLGGSDDDAFNNHLIARAFATRWCWPSGETPEAQAAEGAFAARAMMAFNPQDEIEGMMAAQAVAMHNASMEASRKAMLHQQPHDIAQGLRKAAASASRTFLEIVSALDRKRGKGGNQKVTVEHVHVHAGGQAIVGNIEPGLCAGGGGGAEGKTAEQPHASPPRLANDSAACAVMPPLRRAHQKWELVPGAGDAQRQVPASRREIDGAADG